VGDSRVDPVDARAPSLLRRAPRQVQSAPASSLTVASSSRSRGPGSTGCAFHHAEDAEMKRWQVRHWLLFLAFALFNAVLLPFTRSMPVWDAHLFFDCALNAARDPLNVRHYLCCNHPSPLFIALFALPQMVSFGTIWLLHGEVLLLGNASVIAFFFIAKKLLGRDRLSFAPELATLCYAAHPIILGNMLHFTLDLGVVCFFLITFAFLLHERVWWATVAGFIAVFTKESGVAMFGMLVVVDAVGRFFLRDGSDVASLKRAWARRAPLMLPIGAFFLYLLAQKYLFHQFPLWNDNVSWSIHDRIPALLFSLHLDRRFGIMLADVVVLNFQWIALCFVLLGTIVFFLRKLLPTREVQPRQDVEMRQNTITLIVLFATGLFVLTRYIPFNNVRYFLPLYPLFLLLTFKALLFTFRSPRVIAVLGCLLLLGEVVGIYDSVDPVSRRIYGSAPFGSHALYNMVEPAGDSCCGVGRDQSVYNVEFRMLSLLQEKAYRELRPTKNTTIAASWMAWRGFNDRLDPITFAPTYTRPFLRPRYVNLENLMEAKLPIESTYFLHYAPFEKREDSDLLLTRYDVTGERTISLYGFTLPITLLSAKP
jgi:hypothetical protein